VKSEADCLPTAARAACDNCNPCHIHSLHRFTKVSHTYAQVALPTS
jgi:hypothetical protein